MEPSAGFRAEDDAEGHQIDLGVGCGTGEVTIREHYEGSASVGPRTGLAAGLERG
jgi:hypothetical protein